MNEFSRQLIRVDPKIAISRHEHQFDIPLPLPCHPPEGSTIRLTARHGDIG
jgi:hypothetical protein